jgi:hypothetical protein
MGSDKLKKVSVLFLREGKVNTDANTVYGAGFSDHTECEALSNLLTHICKGAWASGGSRRRWD